MKQPHNGKNILWLKKKDNLAQEVRRPRVKLAQKIVHFILSRSPPDALAQEGLAMVAFFFVVIIFIGGFQGRNIDESNRRIILATSSQPVLNLISSAISAQCFVHMHQPMLNCSQPLKRAVPQCHHGKAVPSPLGLKRPNSPPLERVFVLGLVPPQHVDLLI